MRSTTFGVALAIFLSTAAAGGASGQDPDPARTILRLTISLESKAVAQTNVIDGTMTTIHIRGRGHYGFRPTIEGDGLVNIEVYRITSGVVGPSQTKIESFVLRKASTASLSVDSGISIGLEEVVEAQRQLSLMFTSAQLTAFGDYSAESSSGNCCVTCGTITTCGCAVTMSCGCCCAECTNKGCTGCNDTLLAAPWTADCQTLGQFATWFRVAD